MAPLQHVHRYQRIKWKTGQLAYKCMRDGCTHFINAELLEGKECECYVCKETFIVDSVQAQRKRPHCKSCRAKGSRITIPIARAVSVNELVNKWKEKLGG
jgi:hypothetical protein